jgi:hypothetical protein
MLFYFDPGGLRHAGLQKLLNDFDNKPSSNRTSVVQNESDVYESNSARLLVKALYNGGNGVSIASKFQYLQHCHVVIPGSDLTPDFLALVRYPPNTPPPRFPSCLVSTLSKSPPQLLETTDLSSPPPSPDSASSATASSDSSPISPPVLSDVVFEFSLDYNLWNKKMVQLERYASAIKRNTNALPCLVGLGFATNKKFGAIRHTLTSDKGSKFPTLWNLHKDGRFLVFLCDRSFVSSTYSDISSQSGKIDNLQSLVVGLVRVLVSDNLD